jgi:hypothetical protein
MAVVFISPKHKQKVFFMGITISLVAFVVLISLWSFLGKPSTESTQTVFNKPKVSLNVAILDNEQFKATQPFDKIPLQFSYSARDSKNRVTKGLISATSEEEALKLIETGTGLNVSEIQEIGLGRDNPFIPYPAFITSASTTNQTTK